MSEDTERTSEKMAGNSSLAIKKIINNICESNLNIVVRVKFQKVGVDVNVI
jgi:hypothetical protein